MESCNSCRRNFRADNQCCSCLVYGTRWGKEHPWYVDSGYGSLYDNMKMIVEDPFKIFPSLDIRNPSMICDICIAEFIKKGVIKYFPDYPEREIKFTPEDTWRTIFNSIPQGFAITTKGVAVWVKSDDFFFHISSGSLKPPADAELYFRDYCDILNFEDNIKIFLTAVSKPRESLDQFLIDRILYGNLVGKQVEMMKSDIDKAYSEYLEMWKSRYVKCSGLEDFDEIEK